MVNSKDELFKIIKDKNVYCYGAGNYGKALAYILYDMDVDLKGFIVTNKKESFNILLGKPIFQIDKLIISDDDCILVSVNEMLQDEIKNELLSRNIFKFYCISEKLIETLEASIKFQFNTQSNKFVNVLLYHRVCDLKVDPWRLATKPEQFELQMKYIKENYNILRFEDDWSNVKQKSIVITFDDGYIDNYQYAIPILDKYNIPATFFICTDNIGTKDLFWWDELTTILFNPRVNGMELNYNNKKYKLNGQTEKKKVCMEIRNLLIDMDDEKRRSDLKYIHNILSKVNFDVESNRSMNIHEIREISKNHNITIGAHTKSHTRLAGLDYEQQYIEINESKIILQNMIGTEVNVFSYPFGEEKDFTKKTIEIVKKSGFKKAAMVANGLYENSKGDFLINRNTIKGGINIDLFERLIKRQWYEYRK